VAKIEDDSPSFKNLELSGAEAVEEDLVSAEPVSEPEAVAVEADLLAGLPPVAEAPPAEPPAAEPEKAAKSKRKKERAAKPPREKKEKKEPLAKEDDAFSRMLPMAVVVGLPVVAIGLAIVNFAFFSTALYLVAMGYIVLGIWICRKTNTVYAILLGCALAALLTAVYCLWIEMGRYEFSVKAKQGISAICPGHNPSDRSVARLIA
jgi:hypothetical protein